MMSLPRTMKIIDCYDILYEEFFMSHVLQEKAIGIMMGTLPSLPCFKDKI